MTVQSATPDVLINRKAVLRVSAVLVFFVGLLAAFPPFASDGSAPQGQELSPGEVVEGVAIATVVAIAVSSRKFNGTTLLGRLELTGEGPLWVQDLNSHFNATVDSSSGRN